MSCLKVNKWALKALVGGLDTRRAGRGDMPRGLAQGVDRIVFRVPVVVARALLRTALCDSRSG